MFGESRPLAVRLSLSVLAVAGLVACAHDEVPVERRLQEALDARAPRCWECPLRDRCPYPDKTPKPG